VSGPTGYRYLNDARQFNYVKGGWNCLGDVLSLSVALTRIGRASLEICYEIHAFVLMQRTPLAIKLRATSVVVY